MDPDKVQMEIVGLTSSPHSSGSYALILQETAGPRRLSILIGQESASNIAVQLEAITPPRPVTHDLLRSILDSLGVNVLEVLISELRDGTFYALIRLDKTSVEIDARPSDAIALAIRCGSPIYVAESVMREAGIVSQEEDEEDDDEADVLGEHQGAEPNEPSRPKSMRDVLQGKLDEAIKIEDYELAAQLRDELDRLDGSTA